MTAFRASYADLKIVKTRGTCQIVLEIPLEQADAALEILGGVPRPDREVWVGVARLEESAATEKLAQKGLRVPSDSPMAGLKDRKPFHTLPLPTQAALICKDERFQKWAANGEWAYEWRAYKASGTGPEMCAIFFIYTACNITSRGILANNPEAAERFLALVERYRRETGLDPESR